MLHLQQPRYKKLRSTFDYVERTGAVHIDKRPLQFVLVAYIVGEADVDDGVAGGAPVGGDDSDEVVEGSGLRCAVRTRSAPEPPLTATPPGRE